MKTREILCPRKGYVLLLLFLLPTVLTGQSVSDTVRSMPVEILSEKGDTLLPVIPLSTRAMQGGPDIQMPKMVPPEAATMMKYVDQPVNLNHGLVNIEIPLFELTEGEIRLPVTLSYNSSGFKVRELSGRVGYGWSLNLESSVSRSVNGLADEVGYLVSRGRIYNNKMDLERLADGEGSMDEDPDAFYYKLLNKSGKFYFKRNGTLENPGSTISTVTVPFEPIIIDHYRYNGNIQYFDITDDEGFFYRFGKSLTSTRTGRGKSGAIDSHWKATEVVSPNKKDTLHFIYSPNPNDISVTWNLTDYIAIEEMLGPNYNYTNFSSYTGCPNQAFPSITENIQGRSSTHAINMTRDSSLPNMYIGSKGEHLCDMNYPGAGRSNSILSDQAIETIETRNVKMNILSRRAAQGTEVQSIQIIDKITNTVIRTIRFTINDYRQGITGRRKLEKVEILDKNDLIIEKYSFDYYNSASVVDHNSKNIDHWGYSNGFTTDARETGVPYQEIRGDYYYGQTALYPFKMNIGRIDKSPSEYYSRFGMLQSITYPTGRKTTLYYEGNKYKDTSQPGEPILPAGGLRISKITEYDPISTKTITRLFTYGENENGGGHIKYKITLDDYRLDKKINYGMSFYSSSGYTVKLTIYNAVPFPNGAFSGGSPVYYTHVTERRVDAEASNKPLGKTTYLFNDPMPDIRHITGTSLVYDIDRNTWMAGKLLKKSEYEYLEDLDLYRPHRDEEYVYGIYKMGTMYYGKTYRKVEFINMTNEYNKLYYSDFHNEMGFHDSGCMRLTSEKTTTYVSGISMKSTERNYRYSNPNHMYATEIREKNSNGVISIINKKYTQDIPISAMVRENRLNILMEQTLTNNSDSKRWIERVNYSLDPTNSIYLPKSLSKGYSSPQERMVIEKYDEYGNPAQIIKDGISVVCIWGYKGKYLVAEIVNSTYDQVSTNMGGQTFINNLTKRNEPSSTEWNKLKNLRNISGVQATISKYKPAYGVSEVFDSRGISTYYDYDNAGRLKEVYFMDGSQKRIIEAYDYQYRNQ